MTEPRTTLFETNPPFCPGCESKLDGATAVEGDVVPEPGDVTICLYCREFLQYNPEMRLKVLSHDEFLALHEDNQIALLRVKLRIEEMNRGGYGFPDKRKRK